MQVSGIMERSQGVRKGAWSKFEDDLLKACVQNYGEGKWHLVPQRAGLNRCRKSCRLRWLNYLKPNIKRGDFSEDEVDLMIKLHKLLGNRCVGPRFSAAYLSTMQQAAEPWSLIAGRLPGRTSNDVKNYWNTYMKNKKEKNIVQQEDKTVKPHEVIKPQPRTFSKSSSMWLQEKLTSSDPSSSKVSMSNEGGAGSNWWETLLHDNGEEDGVLMKDSWDQEELNSITTNPFDFLTEGQTWNDFLDQI